MSDVKYPDIEVCLSECDGNADVIIGMVRRALRKARVPDAKIAEFTKQTQSGDYDNVLRTCMEWVDVT